MKLCNFNAKTVNLSKISSIYFIGIGGISVSALAKFCISQSILVSGSDLTENSLTKELQNLGAKIYIGHSENNIIKALEMDEAKKTDYKVLKGNRTNKSESTPKPKNSKSAKSNNKSTNNKNKYAATLVVYSGAINENNPELIYAKTQKIVCLERSTFLGVVANSFENVISVSGTHGKTTTTALIGQIFITAGLNPTIHLGGEIANGYSNFLAGAKQFFITEACEYKKSFESLHSTYSVITNIEQDHMDSYNGVQDLYNSFNTFANQTKKTVIANIADKNKLSTKSPTVFCGIKNKHHNYYVKNIKTNKQGKQLFSVYKNNIEISSFSINLTGKYNVYNALYAIVLALQLNINTEIIKKALAEFKGIKRRNEFMGYINNLPVYADYAHHPTEIKQSLKNYKKTHKKVLLVFQPHTFSRTKTLFAEFIGCFKNANNLIMLQTYPAREEYDFNGSEENLFNNIIFRNRNKVLCLNRNELHKKITENIKKNRVILFLGAGNAYDYINKLLD